MKSKETQMKPGQNIIGFIGLGVMGKSMAGHILDAGYELHVYTRTKTSAASLVEKGAIWEESVAQLSAKCDAVISIVGFPLDVEQVYLGEGGVVQNARTGCVIIDMTTSSPVLAQKIYDEAAQRDVHALDAPVSGGDIGAKNAALSIMVGGDRPAFDKVLPLFEIMGKNVVYQGKAGSGQHTKMVNQIAIASGMVAVCEAIAYAGKSGLDPETVLKSIEAGAAGSWTLSNLAPRMIKGDFEPGFYIKHFIKDMTIASEVSKEMGLNTPGLEMTLGLYRKMADQGFAEKGTQALFKLFDQ